MAVLAHIGEVVLRVCKQTLNAAGLIFAVLVHCVNPRSWRRTVRSVFVRQILFTGVEALPLTLLIAVMAGISIVAQAQVYLSRLGQSELTGTILVLAMVRIVGPLLIGFIVVGRSGTAIAAELASMRVRKEVELLESMGIEPTTYLIMPRVLAMPVAMFALTVFFLVTAFVTGWAFGVVFFGNQVSPAVFAEKVFSAMSVLDVAAVTVVALLSGLVTGAICCQEGINTTGSATDVPRAVGKSVVRSVAAILLICTILSIIAHV